MERTFTFLRVRGIPIGANWAWLLIAGLIAWSLGSQLFPETYPGLGDGTYVVMGVVAALLFFASILLHELGHAFRALKEGMEIEGITLWILGGVAQFKGMFPSAGAEFRIAIAGPLVSVALAVGFGVFTWLGNAVGWPAEVVGVADYLTRINVLVVGFNLVPALPLDGGRVLRSWLWHRQGSFSSATESAAKAGRGFGGVLIGLGVLGFVTGAGFGGLWFVLIGWFLLQAAQAEASFALMRQSLSGFRVRDVMTPDPATVSSDLTLLEFIDAVSRSRGHSTYPVVDDGRLVGLVSLRLAGAVPASDRSARSVADVMTPLADVPVLSSDEGVIDVVARLQEGPSRGVVTDDGRVLGIVSMSDIARTLELERLQEPADVTRRTKRGAWIPWVVVGATIVLAGGYLYRPPVAVLAPGEAFDVTGDISLGGVPTDPVNGAYMLTSVRLAQPNAFGLALAVLRSEQVVPLQAVIPEGQDPGQFLEEQQDLFRESQLLAAAAAARSAGMEVGITGTGVRVVDVLGGTPAASVLEPDDVIVEVEGEPVLLAQELQTLIRARPPATTFDLTVERDGAEVDVEVTSTRLSGGEGTVGIGVFIETRGLDVTLPFSIEFRDREIGGPSAGLVYALAIADMLDPDDIADGRNIATTGTIDLEGRVGPVGGVGAKAAAARAQGADLFLVPAAEIDQADDTRLPARGVSSLEDALALLRKAA